MAYTTIDKPSDYFETKLYTGNGGTLNVTGLDFQPDWCWLKQRNGTYGHDLYDVVRGATKTLNTNNTNAEYTSADRLTSFNSDGFTLGSNASVNGSSDTYADINGSSDTYIAYCFAEKQGYSKFGSYTGNGNADGTFVYLGFKPAFVLIKRTSGIAASWSVRDNKRNTFNPSDQVLYPHLSNIEATQTPLSIDILSNGIKVRGTDSDVNASGATYIYMAFAENPLVTSTGVPACAR